MKNSKLLIPGTIITMLVAIILGCSSTTETTSESTEVESDMSEIISEEKDIEEESLEEDIALSTEEDVISEESGTSDDGVFEIVLDSSILGEYGKEMVINEGTEFEEHPIFFYIPAGTYEASSDSQYFEQINVYTDQKQVNEDGWEEWIIGDEGGCTMLKPGETVEIVVPEGYCIDIFECKITLKKIS